jgi:hypothetical protein
VSTAVAWTADQLEAAVVAAASCARWPDGSLLLDLDEDVLRTNLVPKVLHALTTPGPSTGAPVGRVDA